MTGDLREGAQDTLICDVSAAQLLMDHLPPQFFERHLGLASPEHHPHDEHEKSYRVAYRVDVTLLVGCIDRPHGDRHDFPAFRCRRQEQLCFEIEPRGS